MARTGAPSGRAGPETVCQCLEQAVRGGPKRTGARTIVQNRAVWERPRFSRWPCRRLRAPASVAPTPAGPVCQLGTSSADSAVIHKQDSNVCQEERRSS